MSFASTYNSVSVRGWSTQQSGYYPVATLTVANATQFGFAIDCSYSNYAVIGAPAQAQVFFYAKNNNNIFVNVGSNTGNVGTGIIVSTSGNADYSVVGSEKSFTANLIGDAYVFERSGNTFTRSRLVNPNQANRDDFGQGVAMANNGNYCAVTADRQGNIYCYQRSGNTWNYHSLIDRANIPNVALQYISMNEDGTKLVNGFPTNIGPQGEVFVLSRSNTTWTLDQTLTASDGSFRDGFGEVVKITPSGNNILVCAPGADVGNISNVGTVYVFTYNNSTNLYDETHKINSPSPLANSFFGGTADISDDGNTIVVSTTFNIRQLFIYEKNISNNYVLINIFNAPVANSFFGIGTSITGDANSILTGAEQANIGNGTVYQFNKS